MTADKILQFCKSEYGTEVCTMPGAVNIIYLEGCDFDTLAPNNDAPDLWNDTSLIILHDNHGQPFIAHQSQATSEPGLSATKSKRAESLGGVARITIGFQKECWVEGYHKGNPNHPALIQAKPITVHRDKNKDGKRTGDIITTDVKGLNQHGTKPNLVPLRVSEFSYACLVRRLWANHLDFMRLVYADPRRSPINKFYFSSTVADYSKMWKSF